MGGKKSKSKAVVADVSSDDAEQKEEQATRLAGLSEEEVEKARSVFTAADTNGNGKLEANELTVVLRNLQDHHGREIRDEDTAMALFDVDLSGAVDFDEFITLYAAWIKK
jgi:Ca2+-binding EF-hand superfamily protein